MTRPCNGGTSDFESSVSVMTSLGVWQGQWKQEWNRDENHQDSAVRKASSQNAEVFPHRAVKKKKKKTKIQTM